MMSSKIIHGENVKVLKTLEANSIDLTVTSPPYDNLRNYNGYSFDFESLKKELFRVTKEGGVVVWVVGDATVKGSETGSSFKQALGFIEEGFRLHDTMIYQKDNPPPVGGHNRYYQAFEYMFIFSKGSPKTFNPQKRPRRNKYNDKRTRRFKAGVRNKDGSFVKKETKINTIVKRENVWRYVVGGGNSTKDKEAFKHPAIFPEKLALDHILSWSNEGDLVLDPFCGSGTTLKIAHQSGRRFIGVDISFEYCEIATRRVFNAEPALFPEGVK